MISLKFKNLSVIKNYERYLLIIVSVVLFSFFKFESFVFIILFYVVLSMIINMKDKILKAAD
jgi:phage shock protein PspC (stress-responsive transcriptional regulator)